MKNTLEPTFIRAFTIGVLLIFSLGIAAVIVWLLWMLDAHTDGWRKAQQVIEMLIQAIFWPGVLLAIINLLPSKYLSNLRISAISPVTLVYVGAVSIILLSLAGSFCFYEDMNQDGWAYAGWEQAGRIMWNLTQGLFMGAMLAGLAYLASRGVLPIHSPITMPPNIYHCPSCNEKVQIDWIVCPYCKEELFATVYSCSNCNRQVMPYWKSCPNCGEDLQELEEVADNQEGV